MLADVQHEATESVIVLIVSYLSKYVSALRAVLAKPLGGKEHRSLSLPQRRSERKESTRPRTQSIGPVLLLLHKSQVLLHKRAVGDKDGGRAERGAIPLICALGAFQGKAVGPACFIANASVTSKGT